MKKLHFLIVISILISLNSYPQTPESFNYQAVIRDIAGNLVVNQSVSLRATINDNTADGAILYREIHSISTNEYGLVNLQIGEGSLDQGTFSGINWGMNKKYLKIEIDIGNGYVDAGAIQLLSVPYALYASNVANKDDADANPLNEIQDISLTGTDLSITGGNTIDVSSLQDGFNDADADSTNEIQDLNLTGNILTITDNTSATEIDLTPFQGTNTDEQTLSLTGTDLSITGGNTIDVSSLQDGVDDADNNPLNEIQVLSISNDTIYLADGGFVKLPYDQVNDADYDSLNELQDLLLEGDTLKLSDGNEVVFPYDSSRWAMNGDKMYYNTGNVGIGSSDPVSNLEVKSNSVGTNALFQVINAENDTVFAVYPDGVKVFVNPDAKGKLGGFAISGRSPTKAGEEVEYMRVTNDSTRIYVNEPKTSKGKLGGFAISGRSPTKGAINDYLVITGDSTRIYVNDSSTVKGKLGGFAISGRSPTKGTLNDYLKVTRDSTRVYVTESTTKGKLGGFAISGRSPTKGITRKFMDMTKDNYFIGHESGQKNTDGLYNSFMGYTAGYSNTTGNRNVFIGFEAGYTNTTGSNNSIIGYDAGYSLTTGTSNVMIGFNAGYENESGKQNVFIGQATGKINISGSNNVIMGHQSGYKMDTSFNTFIGYQSGYNDLKGANNVYLGYKSGYGVLGQNNVFLGKEAGYGPISQNGLGNSNVALGYRAGYRITDGINNVFLGSEAGAFNNDGNNNVFLGNKAGYNNEGDFNVFLGNECGYTNTIGEYNTFLGYQAGQSNTEGLYNFFGGFKAGNMNVDGDKNVYIGYQAGMNNDGTYNVLIGHNSGLANLGTVSAVLIGNGAGESMEYGGGCVFIGVSAGGSLVNYNLGNTYIGFQSAAYTIAGSENVAIGRESGLRVSGNNNVILGNYSGANAGSNNVFLGYKAGALNQGTGNVFLGYYAGENITNVSNTLIISNSSTKNLIYGNFSTNRVGIGTSTPASEFEVSHASSTTAGGLTIRNKINTHRWSFYMQEADGDLTIRYDGVFKGQFLKTDGTYSKSSDKRVKKNFEKMNNTLEKIAFLTPQKYHMKVQDDSENKKLGFIAQDVKEIFPELVYYDEDEDLYTMDYSGFGVIAIAAIKEQQEVIKDQANKINDLESRLAEIEKLLLAK